MRDEEEDIDEDHDTLTEEDIDLLDKLHATPPRSTLMNIGLQPSDNTARLRDATVFLTRILDSPTLSGWSIPLSIKGVIYINNTPHHLAQGTWQIDGTYIYMASHSELVEPLIRIAILTAIANLTGAIENPTIVEKISARLTQAISESVRSVYAGIVRSAQQPTRLAVNTALAQVAAEINGLWFTTSGSPAEVNDSWIVMDF